MDEDLPVEELKALAHPLRLRILKALCEQERNVGEIEEVTGIGQPSLSQQLAVLRQAGLVITRRDGKLVYYGVERAAFAQILDCMQKICMADGPATQPVTANLRPASPGAANFARLA